MPSEMKFAHLPGTDLLPGLVVARVEERLDLSPLRVRCRRSSSPRSRSSPAACPPVHADEREQPVLDLVPLACAGG